MPSSSALAAPSCRSSSLQPTAFFSRLQTSHPSFASSPPPPPPPSRPHAQQPQHQSSHHLWSCHPHYPRKGGWAQGWGRGYFCTPAQQGEAATSSFLCLAPQPAA